MTQALLALLLWTVQVPQALGARSIPSIWNSLGHYEQESAGTQYTFYYVALDEVVLRDFEKYGDRTRSKCSSLTATSIVELRHLVLPLFQRRVLGNSSFSKVSYQCLREDISEWVADDRPRFFADDGAGGLQLVEMGTGGSSRRRASLSLRVVPPGAKWFDFSDTPPNLVLCVHRRPLPEPPTTATVATTTTTTAPPRRQSPCRCSGSSSSASSSSPSTTMVDLAWPLASAAFLAAVSLSLAAALLLLCLRRRQKKQPPVVDSIPRTTSSLMDFHEKGQAVASQTLPRRPRVVHHGQVHANGYLTLGSIQARRQREMQRQLGLSEPPSPNRSVARSDCRH